MRKLASCIWEVISGMSTLGFLIALIRSLLSKEPEMIGTLLISPGLMQSLYTIATLITAGVFVVLSWEWLVPRSSAFKFANLHESIREEFNATETDRLLNGSGFRTDESKWVARESLCLALYKLGIKSPDPVQKEDVWHWYLARLLTFSKDQRYKEAKSMNVSGLQWSPNTHLPNANS